MTSNPLNDSEKKILLQLARQSMERGVYRQPLIDIQLEEYSLTLQAWGASFVTLTESGDLRGCIGALESYQPLVQDVCEHAVAAALDDYRFPPVQPAELGLIHIEISRLTPPTPLTFVSSDDLLGQLRAGVDGVILRDGSHRATFLPQVWEKIPDKEEFLGHLCQKMGAPASLWRKKMLAVAVYQVEEFHE
jgi:uncharacterized protein